MRRFLGKSGDFIVNIHHGHIAHAPGVSAISDGHVTRPSEDLSRARAIPGATQEDGGRRSTRPWRPGGPRNEPWGWT